MMDGIAEIDIDDEAGSAEIIPLARAFSTPTPPRVPARAAAAE